MLLDRLGKNASQGPPPNDPLLDETVSFKTVIGLKWIIWRSGKYCFWADLSPNRFGERAHCSVAFLWAPATTKLP